jgi:hypothetical protein
MSAGMFDPLPSIGARPAPAGVPEWRVIMPAPEDAPSPPAAHPRLGGPFMTWEYRDSAGRLNGYVCCFERVPTLASSPIRGDGKQIRSLVFTEHKKWGRQWRWLGFPKPRPLYGLDRLAARPDAPAVICEGEKAADAAGRLLPDHVAVTSPGGSSAAKAADWSALAGRYATIWPDAGQSYAREVCETLAKLSPAPRVAIVKPPPSVAEGWDAADALAQGWTPAQAAELIARAAAHGHGGATTAPALNARSRVIDLLADAELWHDPERTAYATVPVDGHRENHELGSTFFKDWLALSAYEATGSVPAAETIEAALRVARAQALRGPCHRTWRRVAEHDGRIYLDLGCRRWRAVEIAATGWRVVDTISVKFLRSRHGSAAGTRGWRDDRAAARVHQRRERFRLPRLRRLSRCIPAAERAISDSDCHRAARIIEIDAGENCGAAGRSKNPATDWRAAGRAGYVCQCFQLLAAQLHERV